MLPECAAALSLPEPGLSPLTLSPICSWLGCYSLRQESWLSRSGKRSSLPGCKGPRFGKLSELKKRPSSSSSLLSAKSIIVPFSAFLNVLSNFIWKWTMGCCFHPFPPANKIMFYYCTVNTHSPSIFGVFWSPLFIYFLLVVL